MAQPRLRIAVVDDDRSVRRALRRLLEVSDLETETFASGQEFLDWHRQAGADCVILDLRMPKDTGLDIIKVMSREVAPVPVIIVTAHDAPEAREACKTAGASAYLLKPLDERTLLAAIAKATGSAPTLFR